jgi:hypothetical protein
MARPQIRIMPYYRFKIGQTVTTTAPEAARGAYTIVRLLPLVGNEAHYWVRSTVDQQVRALLESQIRLIVMEPAAAVERPTAVKPASKKVVRRRR